MTEVASREERAVAPRLEVLAELFRHLHDASVRYCHWKSNEHLAASMTGAGDLDLLFARDDAQALTRVLVELGFKRLVVRPGWGYPGVEDYIGLDRETWRLTHLHLHYQLTLGEKFLKGRRLPWEALMLESRVQDPQYGVYIAEPNLELLMLVVRAALKIRARDLVAGALGRKYVRGGMAREFRWLAERAQPLELDTLATDLLGPRANEAFHRILASTIPSLPQLLRLRRAARPPLSDYRLYGRLDGLRRQWIKELQTIGRRVGQRALGAPTRSTRTPPHGGLVVAFVGADGSGKSTIVREISRWLSREADVVTMYGGSGDGPRSLMRRVLQRVFRAVRRRPPRRASQAAAERAQTIRPVLVDPGTPGGSDDLKRMVYALLLAREKRKMVGDAWRARSRGQIVLCDRFPQRQFASVNDGPLLTDWLLSRSRLWHGAAVREQRTYEWIEPRQPDVVVKLHVSLQVALERKRTPTEQLRTKIDVVRQLSYPPACRVVDVDATQPLDRVLAVVKEAVWESI